MLGILADDHDTALALDDLALLADRLDRRSNLHLSDPPRFVFSTLAAPGDATPGQIIGRNFDFDLIARIDADEIHADLSGDLSHDFMPAGYLNAEIRVRQRFDDDAFNLDIVALGQR